MKRRNLMLAGLLPGLGLAQAQPRIVSVGGAVTETVFALGAQGQLVGVDTTSLFPADATRLPQVGYARTLSAEGVLALLPQLLLASGEAGPPQVLAQLQRAGVRVEVLDEQHRFDGILARTARIGQLCGREREAAQLQARLQQDWAARPKPPAGSAPRVLFVLAHAGGQLRVAGEGTGADAMLALAGARNAFAGVQGYKPLTAEATLQAAPDVGEAPALAAGHVLEAEPVERGHCEYQLVHTLDGVADGERPDRLARRQIVLQLIQDAPGVERDLVARDRRQPLRRGERRTKRTRRREGMQEVEHGALAHGSFHIEIG